MKNNQNAGWSDVSTSSKSKQRNKGDFNGYYSAVN